MPVIVIPDDFGVYAQPLSKNGYACTINLDASYTVHLIYILISFCGYTLYPEVLIILFKSDLFVITYEYVSLLLLNSQSI